jgi:hypothetical protein
MSDNAHFWLNVAVALAFVGAAMWFSVLRYTNWGDE